MLEQITSFFRTNIAADSAGQPAGQKSVALATTALLIELMRSDADEQAVEQEVILQAIRRQFELNEQDAKNLTELANQELKQATDYFQFTSLINSEFSPAQKLQVLEAAWLVAYADKTISAHERHMMRKVGALLHVPDGDHMLAKDRARVRAGL